MIDSLSMPSTKQPVIDNGRQPISQKGWVGWVPEESQSNPERDKTIGQQMMPFGWCIQLMDFYFGRDSENEVTWQC